MALQITALAADFSVSPQLLAEDLAWVSAQGFKTLINNRPDGEGGDAQPTTLALEAAARAAGLRYAYLPVVSGFITMEQVQALRDLLVTAPRPLLAFCRSGARSAQLLGLAQQLD